MTEITILATPQARLKQFVCDYAMQFHGVEVGKASAAARLCDVMFSAQATNSEIIASAREVMRYTEVPARSSEVVQPKTGPDVLVNVMGVCGIQGRPLIQAEDGVYEVVDDGVGYDDRDPDT